MLTRLPFEIVDHIIEYLDFEDIPSIARVSSTFRVPAQLRLFKTTHIIPKGVKSIPDYMELVLSSPHLLQYPSCLVVQCFAIMKQTSIQSLWSYLPNMSRLRNMDIFVQLNDCLRVLSALESLCSEREITLSLSCHLAPDLLFSDDPLPVHTLNLFVEASTHEVATRLIQKCSQSLRKLTLLLEGNITAPMLFLPHLDELSFSTTRHYQDYHDLDLMSLFPFLAQHPTITRISLGPEFTLAVQPPPDLLPNLQFLSATPAVIERLIPGRSVNDIHAQYFSDDWHLFPDDIILRPLLQPFVPVTTFTIKTDSQFRDGVLINIVRALPKLRKFTLNWPCFEFRDLLPALGRCKDMVHIQIYPSLRGDPGGLFGPLWSRGNFVQMVQRVQENGASGLWSFELHANNESGWQEGCEAMRIGWLDVPRQPALRGEWRFDVWESSSDSDMLMFGGCISGY